MSLFAPLETYEVLRNKDVKIASILQFHFKRILASLYRKISFHQKYRNPWVIEVTEYISSEVYYQFFRAVRDYKISYGVVAKVTKDSKGFSKEYILEFNHLGAFRFHLKEVANESVDNYFKKSNSIGNNGSIIVSDEKKAVFKYKVGTGTLNIQLHYTVTNKYGNCVSF